MSDQPTLTSPSIQDVLPSTSSTTINSQEFACDFPGCDVKKDTLRGLNAHKGQAHKRHAPKKRGRPKGSTNKAKPAPMTPTQRKQAVIPNLRPIWQVGDQIILVGPNDEVWIAKKVIDGS